MLVKYPYTVKHWNGKGDAKWGHHEGYSLSEHNHDGWAPIQQISLQEPFLPWQDFFMAVLIHLFYENQMEFFILLKLSL